LHILIDKTFVSRPLLGSWPILWETLH